MQFRTLTRLSYTSGAIYTEKNTTQSYQRSDQVAVLRPPLLLFSRTFWKFFAPTKGEFYMNKSLLMFNQVILRTDK